MSTAGDLLQRIRELSVQSANGTNSDSDRASIQNEVSALSKELNRVADTTQFNGQNVLDGSLTSAQFQVGANSGQTINIGIQSAKATDIGNNSLTSTFAAGGGTLSDAVASAATATTAHLANNQLADTLNITSGTGVTTNVAISAGDSAKKIAANVNALSSQSGVTASAKTVTTISGLADPASGDGSVQFTLRGDNSLEADANSTGVTISAKSKAATSRRWPRPSMPRPTPPGSRQRSRPIRPAVPRNCN